MTHHPRLRKMRLHSESRLLFLKSFFVQYSTLLLGLLPCLGHPCQKHPSTKIAIFNLGNAKSGRPGSGRCRRQPDIPARRNAPAKANSVLRLRRDRIAAITFDRFCFVKTSAMFTKQIFLPNTLPNFLLFPRLTQHYQFPVSFLLGHAALDPMRSPKFFQHPYLMGAEIIRDFA